MVHPTRHAFTVCAHAHLVLAVGSKHWMLGDLKTGTWRDVKPADAGQRAMECVTQDGALWVVDGGILTSQFWVWSGDTWRSQALPVRDVRVVAFDPQDARRAVLGSWGEGVWMTAGASGRSWRLLGLRGAEVRDLSVGPGLRHVHVSTSNAIFPRGVYQWAGPAL